MCVCMGKYAKRERYEDRKMKNEIGKGLASIAVCILGGAAFWVTKDSDPTGIGWAILGLFIIWSWS